MGTQRPVVVCHSRRLPQLDLNNQSTPEKPAKWQTRLLRYGPLLVWIAAIFFFSSRAASADQTSRIIGPLLQFLFPSAAPETLQQYHFFIRKCAHVTEYALLAFFAVRALSNSSIDRLRNYRYLLAVGVVIVIASLDEYNQSLEPSRTGSGYDVMLDISGGAAMAVLIAIIGLLRRRRSPRQIEFSDR